MRNIPGHSLFDSSLALIEEGNYFIANRCQRYQSPLFVTRLLLRRTLCMRGEMAAQLFYDQRMFSGHDGAPRLLQKILFGVDVAPGLDGAAQPQRRQLFTQALQTEQVERLVNLAEQQWLAALQRWEGQPHVLMLPEIETLLCKAVCRWAGIQLGDDEAAERRQQLAAQLDGAGRLGWGRLAAWRARGKAQAWARRLIARQRAGSLGAPVDSAIALASRYRDSDGKLLRKGVAALELLNLLRPVVAVARFIVLAVLELHRHPQWQQRLAQDDEWLRPFTREVRRLYAFLPFIAVRVRQDFVWQDYAFKAGSRVLLDLYGTSRDPVTWQQAEVFMPERFITWPSSACGMLAQGGARALQQGCPDEELAMVLIESALRLFCRRMHYTVAGQDPDLSGRRMPMLSASCLVLSEIAAVHQ